MTARLSLLVVAYGRHELVQRLLASLRAHPDRDFIAEVVLVDNGWPERGDSRDHVAAEGWPFPVRFVRNEARSYSSGVNRGAAAAQGDILVAANSDLEWLPTTSIAPLARAFDGDPRLGVAGPQLLFPDGRWQQSDGSWPSVPEALGSLFFLDTFRQRALARRAAPTARQAAWIAGAFLATRRACFEAVGGFDESFSFYGEDVDYCWRAGRAGWSCRVIAAATLVHIRGESSRTRAPYEYLKRLAIARRRIVLRRSGRLAGWSYGWLISLAAAERWLLSRLSLLPGSQAGVEEHRDWWRATREAARAGLDGSVAS